MEILFQTQTIQYLAEKRYDDLHQEQTGEINLPENLPALGRVVDCFGTVLVRDRSVDSAGGSVTVSGGIQTGPQTEGQMLRTERKLNRRSVQQCL